MDGDMQETVREVDVAGIMERIPHRYPFLLIDSVRDIEPGESAVGVKNVTINEPFFQGHFPDHPIMPGVLIVEAMAQTAAIVVIEGMEKSAKDALVYFMSIDNARFRKPVLPGHVVELRVHKEHGRGKVWRFKGGAYVNDKLMAEATFTAMIMHKADGA